MDRRTAEVEMQAKVKAGLETIKVYMPRTYALILERSQPQALGSEAFALVRRGLRGEEHCFFASEAGHWAGAMPFVGSDETDQVKRMIVDWSFGLFFMFDRRIAPPPHPPTGSVSGLGSCTGNSTPAQKLVGGNTQSEQCGAQGGPK